MVKFGVEVVLQRVQLTEIRDEPRVVEYNAIFDHPPRLRPAQFHTRERRARLHTDLARIWWQAGNSEQTAFELLAAHKQSSAEVLCRPSIRKVADEIVMHHPRTRGAADLSNILRAHAHGGTVRLRHQ